MADIVDNMQICVAHLLNVFREPVRLHNILSEEMLIYEGYAWKERAEQHRFLKKGRLQNSSSFIKRRLVS